MTDTTDQVRSQPACFRAVTGLVMLLTATSFASAEGLDVRLSCWRVTHPWPSGDPDIHNINGGEIMRIHVSYVQSGGYASFWPNTNEDYFRVNGLYLNGRELDESSDYVAAARVVGKDWGTVGRVVDNVFGAPLGILRNPGDHAEPSDIEFKLSSNCPTGVFVLQLRVEAVDLTNKGDGFSSYESNGEAMTVVESGEGAAARTRGTTPRGHPVNVTDWPSNARTIDVKSLADAGYPNRSLAVWMVNPKQEDEGQTDYYTAPQFSSGSAWCQGPTRVSLIDAGNGRLLNTIAIRQDYAENEDEFVLPVRIRNGYCYHVDGVTGDEEGTPTIAWFRDLNGDGKSMEFVLSAQQHTMSRMTTLIGYDPDEDMVVQYPVELTCGGKTATTYWVDFLFTEEPSGPGRWSYEIDTRGRGGSLDRYRVSYDAEARIFRGTLVSTPSEDGE